MAAKTTDAGATTDPQGKTDKDIAGGYTGAIGSVDRAIETLTGLRDSLREQGVAVSEAGEVRRRAQDAALYDLNKERQTVKDGYAREDAERDAAHQERDAELTEREDLLVELLGLPEGTEVNAKDLRAAFDKRITDAETAAAGKAKGMAEKEAAAAAKLAAATEATASALLKQENEQLKKANADLKAQNDSLLANQQKVVGDMKEVATGAFNAAGGVVAAGNAALGTAASGGQRPGTGR